ncbi:hypothetical protein AK89_02660 [Enterococcus mundtii CRL35]|nr:hypothetical protein AK89_02660 [Enterococcus mundtii CRL35]
MYELRFNHKKNGVSFGSFVKHLEQLHDFTLDTVI